MKIKSFILIMAVAFLVIVSIIIAPVFMKQRFKSRTVAPPGGWPQKPGVEAAIQQAIAAEKRGDHAAQEKFIKKELALDYDDMNANNLMKIQEKRGEYADALVTMRLIMNPIDPTHNPGNREVLGRFSAGPVNVSRYSSFSGETPRLLHYAELCDKAGAKAESDVVWGRILNNMNDNATLGKGWIESPEGRKLTKAQLRELAKQTMIMSDVDAKSPKKIAAARTILRIAPQCEPARKWLANKLYAERNGAKQGAAKLREAEQNYQVLAHASDAATRKEAGETLQEIANHRAAVAGHGPVYAELDFAYSRHRLIRKVNGKVVEEHYLP